MAGFEFSEQAASRRQRPNGAAIRRANRGKAGKELEQRGVMIWIGSSGKGKSTCSAPQSRAGETDAGGCASLYQEMPAMARALPQSLVSRPAAIDHQSRAGD